MNSRVDGHALYGTVTAQGVFLLACLCYSPSLAQSEKGSSTQVQDSIRYFLDELVITADRMENRVANSTASISVVRSQELSALPISTFSTLFRFVPGFSVVDMDGIGKNPIINARGFYGGGEAEYNVVLIDGKQINDLESGVVNWNLVPIENIDLIEIARGTSSPLYGDAALGSVMNIRTKTNNQPGLRIGMNAGSLGGFMASARQRGVFGESSYGLNASIDRITGFRNHSAWRGTNLGGDLSFQLHERSVLRLSTMNEWVKEDDPGPLTGKEAIANRAQSSVYYRADMKDEMRNHIHLDYVGKLSDQSVLTAGASYRRKDGTTTRTLTNPAAIIDPNSFSVIGLYDTTLYGDTKERVARTHQFGLSLQYSLTSEIGGIRNRTVIGTDETYGKLTSTYYNVQTGFANDYYGPQSARGSLIADGKNRRWSHALYVNNEMQVADPLILSFGARYDNIDDRSEYVVPDTALTSRNDAFSPKIGLNFRYSDNADYSGHFYASFNRSFKAPTLDQLSDQRPIDVALFIPTGPSTYIFVPQRLAPISNSSLKPQKGTSYEAGVYQRFTFQPGSFAELSVSLYQIDMLEEIDFDITTFQYRNIVESRHRGLESGLRLHWLPELMIFFNYTWTSVRFSSGPNSGNYLKSIPRNTVATGLTYRHSSGLQASVVWDFVARIMLDDENTTRLPNYNRGSIRLAYVVAPLNLFIDVENILGAEFSTTGYILTGTTYLFPAARRVIRGGISVGLE